jgi:hypothetical protein
LYQPLIHLIIFLVNTTIQTGLVSAPNTSNHILVNNTMQTGLVSAPNTFNHIF